MGSVWLAEHTMIGRPAAIKMLHGSLSGNQDVTTRFFNEARAAGSIRDAGIVQIFDFGQHTDGRAYIVMELLEGEALDRRLARLKRIPLADALRILRQIATSLGAAHQQGIIHRDLKPDNVFLVRDAEVPGGERAKILDFGIAKVAADVAGMKTNTAVVMGTPMFMSPEQCRGSGKVDQRSDVYALGCVLFTLLVGHTPFNGEGPGDIIAMHLREPPPVPSAQASDIPPAVDALVLRCLEKDPARRYTSASEVAEAIAAIQLSPHAPAPEQSRQAADEEATVLDTSVDNPTTLTSSSTVSQRSEPRAHPARPRRFAPVAAGVVAAAALALALFLSRGSPDEQPHQPPDEQEISNNLRGSSTPPAQSDDHDQLVLEDPPPPAPSLEPGAATGDPAPQPTPAVEPAPSMAAAAEVAVDATPRTGTAPRPPPGKPPGKPTPAAAASTPSLAGEIGTIGAKSAIPTQTPAKTPPAKPTPPTPPPQQQPPPTAIPPNERAPMPTAPARVAINCIAEDKKLEALTKNAYTATADQKIREARDIIVSCLDHTQRVRLALIVVPAACQLNDRLLVERYYELASFPSLRARCPKYLGDEDLHEDDEVESEEAEQPKRIDLSD